MPCSDGGGPSYREDTTKVDNLTRMLCEVCRVGKPTQEVLRWFAAHEAQDRQREEWERQNAADRLRRAEIELEAAKRNLKKRGGEDAR